MLLCTNLALAEMAVLYPVNGAFYTYIVRFVDPSWGFACGWEYALSWLTVLPFELIAASKTIEFWREDIHMVRDLRSTLASTWRLGICLARLAYAPYNMFRQLTLSLGYLGYRLPCCSHHCSDLWCSWLRRG
jgi:amino acid transporter